MLIKLLRVKFDVSLALKTFKLKGTAVALNETNVSDFLITHGGNMQFRNSVNVFLLVISISSISLAQLMPGPRGGGGRPIPYPGGPGGGHGGGGLVPGPYPPGGGHGGHGGGHHGPPPGGGGYYPPPPHNPPPSHPYPGNPYPSDPYPSPYPPTNPGYGNNEIKRIYVGRDIINQLISLRSLAGIDYNYQGYEVVAVRANTRPNNYGRNVAQLVLDGRVWATQVDVGYQLTLIPQQRLILDQSGRDLGLSISGGAYVDTIDIELRRYGGGYNPPPPSSGYPQNINLNLYRTVLGNDRIDLTQYFNLGSYRGRRIEQLIVTASTRYNGGIVNFLVNGISKAQMQFNGSFSQRQIVYLAPMPLIGQGADSLMLYTSGDMTIETVTLVVR